jgi:hypothetical protein
MILKHFIIYNKLFNGAIQRHGMNFIRYVATNLNSVLEVSG